MPVSIVCVSGPSTDYKHSSFIHVVELKPVMTQQTLTAFLMAGIGPVPMTEGSRPAWAQEVMRAIGFKPRLWASDWLMRTAAAAPSFMPVKQKLMSVHNEDVIIECQRRLSLPDALPAVTVPEPSFRKQGFSLDMASILLPCRGNSSALTSTGPDMVTKVLFEFIFSQRQKQA